MKFSIKDLFSKCNQIRRKLRIWSHLLKKSLMKNFIFLCSVNGLLETVNDMHSDKILKRSSGPCQFIISPFDFTWKKLGAFESY